MFLVTVKAVPVQKADHGLRDALAGAGLPSLHTGPGQRSGEFTALQTLQHVVVVRELQLPAGRTGRLAHWGRLGCRHREAHPAREVGVIEGGVDNVGALLVGLEGELLRLLRLLNTISL